MIDYSQYIKKLRELYPIFRNVDDDVAHDAADLLYEFFKWQESQKKDWIEATIEDISLNVGLDANAQRQARRLLKELNLIQEKTKGNSKRLLFQIDQRFYQRLLSNEKKGERIVNELNNNQNTFQSAKPAKIKTGGSFAGPGCLLQGLGLLLFAGSFLMFPVGPLFGLPLLIVLFIWGSSKSRKLHCSQCGNPIDNKKVRLCPACKATFN